MATIPEKHLDILTRCRIESLPDQASMNGLRLARRPGRVRSYVNEKNARLLYDVMKHEPSGLAVGDCVRVDYRHAAPFNFIPEASSAGGIIESCYVLGFAEIEMQEMCRIVGTQVILAQMSYRWDDGIVGTAKRYFCRVIIAGEKLDKKYPQKVLLFPPGCLYSAEPEPEHL